MNEVVTALAREGHIVVRYYCKQKEQRRQRIFEKALDACATSPFARYVERWVLAGIGTGARVAAAVGTRCRGTMAGFLLMSYPLMDPMPSNKGGPAPDSKGPLLKLGPPVLFVTGSRDTTCSLKDLKDLEPDMPAEEKRFIGLQDLDQEFKSESGKGPLPYAISSLCSACVEFMSAIDSKDFESCLIPKLSAIALERKSQASLVPANPPTSQPKVALSSALPSMEPPPRPRVLPPPPQACISEKGTGSVPKPLFFPPRLPIRSHFPVQSYPQLPFANPGLKPASTKSLETELLAHESLQGIDDMGSPGPNTGMGLSLEIRGVGGSVGFDAVGYSQAPGANAPPMGYGWPLREHLQDQQINGQFFGQKFIVPENGVASGTGIQSVRGLIGSAGSAEGSKPPS